MAPTNQKLTSEDKLKVRERIKHSKVKTGCITCRIRRVKCDETKPKCLRCFKYGAECAGYPPARPKASSNSGNIILRPTRTLMPKIQPDQLCLFIPTVKLFESDVEQQYFKFFRSRIVSDLLPYFNCEDWTRTILQSCETHPSIRHAAIAIGALGKTNEIARLSKNIETGERVIMDVEYVGGSEMRLQRTSSEELKMQAYSHHRKALEQYDKAIRCMRKDVECGTQDIRTSLIICMIIICFEAIHGNHKSAAAQLQTGLALVQDFQFRVRRDRDHPQGYSSPSPDVVEDFLVQSFGRLEIQSMSVFDPRPVETHTALKNEGKEVITAMPNPLRTIEQARIYLDLITRRVMHFNGSIHVPRVTPSGSSSAPTCMSPLLQLFPQNGFGNHNPIPWIELRIPLSQTHSTISSEILNQEKLELLGEIMAWHQASNYLLNSAVNGSLHDAISALTLRIAALCTKISLLSAFFLNESAYDSLFPEFRQIVEFATQIITLQKNLCSNKTRNSQDYNPPNLNFSLELALIPALYTVMIKCRHGPTRRRALALLRENQRREGVWDSMASSGLGAWVIGLEEESTRQFYLSSSPNSPSSSGSSSSEFMTGNGEIYVVESRPINFNIPEEIRVRKAKMRFDLLERRANLFCMQMDLKTGRLIEKTGIFKW